MNKIISNMNKNGCVYKSLSFVYRHFYNPLISGRFKYMIKYNVIYRRKEIKRMKALGFDNIKPFNKNSWRIGRHIDKVERRYYTADFSGKKVFVKIAKNDLTTRNEIDIYKRLKEYNFDFAPMCIMSDLNFSKDDTVLLANEYVDGLKTIEPQNANFEHICESFNNVLDNMYALGLVHADIHKGNLMLDSNDNIILMDFGISCFTAVGNSVNYVTRPGTFYKQDGDFRIYDDAFSFLRMIDGLCTDHSVELTEQYKLIKQKVGRISWNVDLSIF